MLQCVGWIMKFARFQLANYIARFDALLCLQPSHPKDIIPKAWANYGCKYTTFSWTTQIKIKKSAVQDIFSAIFLSNYLKTTCKKTLTYSKNCTKNQLQMGINHLKSTFFSLIRRISYYNICVSIIRMSLYRVWIDTPSSIDKSVNRL